MNTLYIGLSRASTLAKLAFFFVFDIVLYTKNHVKHSETEIISLYLKGGNNIILFYRKQYKGQLFKKCRKKTDFFFIVFLPNFSNKVWIQWHSCNFLNDYYNYILLGTITKILISMFFYFFTGKKYKVTFYYTFIVNFVKFEVNFTNFFSNIRFIERSIYFKVNSN